MQPGAFAKVDGGRGSTAFKSAAPSDPVGT